MRNFAAWQRSIVWRHFDPWKRVLCGAKALEIGKNVEIFLVCLRWPSQSQTVHFLSAILAGYLYWSYNPVRKRAVRRQATPPLIIKTDPLPEPQTGVSRVNQEIATLIARKDPVLNHVSKKSKSRLSKRKKDRLEAKVIKGEAKEVLTYFSSSNRRIN